MLHAIKNIIKILSIPFLYFSSWVIALYSIFKDERIGFFLVILFISLPNIHHKMYKFPYGKDFIDILFISILIGLFLRNKLKCNTFNGKLILVYIFYSYVTLWICSSNYSLSAPITTSNAVLYDWKNYAQMLLLYFFGYNIIKDLKDQEKSVMLITIVLLFIALRAFRAYTQGEYYSEESRYEGPFWAVGLGANHFAAFVADYWAFLLGIFLYDINKKRRIFLLITLLFLLHPLFFAYSRGAYAAAAGTLVIYGLFKNRYLLLIILLIFVFWKSVLPHTVIERIENTQQEEQLDLSSQRRLILWDNAITLWKKEPVLGNGFGSFAYSSVTALGKDYTDPHNIYVKFLAEQGVIGFTFLILLLFSAIKSGFTLIRCSSIPFQKGVGLGLIGCVVSISITNAFGDRWSFQELASFFWIIWGISDRIIYELKVSNIPA